MSYRLYVDEVGNDDREHVDDDNNRFLSLTGLAMHLDHARDDVTPNINALKALLRHDPDELVVLHRKDIMNKRRAFEALRDDELREKFDTDLINILKQSEYRVITAVIDKKEMIERFHWRQQHPYHYLMEIIVEKYAQWLERIAGYGDIMPEKRRGPADTNLQMAYESVWANGTYYVESKRIQERIRAKNLKFRGKNDNITGLRLCDIIAHPSYMWVKKNRGHNIKLGPYAEKIIPILVKSKYDRGCYGNIPGYGTKYLP